MQFEHPEHAHNLDVPQHRVARTTFVVICGALMVALICLVFNVYRLQTQVLALQSDLAKSHNVVQSEMTKVRELSTFIATNNRHTMKGIREELDEAKKEVTASAGQARLEAQMNVQRLARELQAEEQRQREIHEQVKSQIADTHRVVATTDARIADMRSEVGSVKHEVAQTQTSLNKAVTDLRRVIGDMGVMSGLIATNQRELEVLKALGDRNYTEFRIPKAKQPQIVSGVGLMLKRTDPGSRRYTLEVVADDVRVQKRDRTINEPVQFYVANRKQPYEIVVNTVAKDEVAGYLATPKLDVDRN